MHTFPRPATGNSLQYSLAAIDIDDTLVGPDKRVSDANARAIAALRDAGASVILASGRSHHNMVRFHRQLGLEGYIVSAQGAHVQDGRTSEILHRDYLPAAIASRVVAEGLEQGMAV